MKETLIAVFEDHVKAGEELKKLEKAGFDMKNLSVAGKDHYEKDGVIAHYVIDEIPKYFGSPFWNSFLYSNNKGTLYIPSVGPLGIGGPLVGIMDNSLEVNEGVHQNFNFLDKALVKIGIPKEKLPKYQSYLKEEKYLLFVHGEDNDISKAKALISQDNPLNLNVYSY